MARFGRTPAYLGFGALLVLGANQFVNKKAVDHQESISNYAIAWHKPEGWRELPHSPQSLFLFQDPKSKVLIRGASSQIVADENPTPDEDSDAMADYYLKTITENMPEWKGERVAGEKGDGVPFALIDRHRDGKSVISAFGVRGNTTLVVTLSANNGDKKALTGVEPIFRDALRQISFRKSKLTYR